MSRAEKFISEYTRNCSNYIGVINNKTCEGYYVPWLTPDEARKDVEIAREEMVEELIEEGITFLEGAHEYTDDKKLQLQYDNEGLIRDFRQFMRQQIKKI